jgi:hypothetical protein
VGANVIKFTVVNRTTFRKTKKALVKDVNYVTECAIFSLVILHFCCRQSGPEIEQRWLTLQPREYPILEQEVSDLCITPQQRNTNLIRDYTVGAQSKESGTELPHEKFHPASYGVKILLTMSNFTLAQFFPFFLNLENLKTVCRPQNIVSSFSTKHFSLP